MNLAFARTRSAIYIHRSKLFVFVCSLHLVRLCSLTRSLTVPLGQSQVAEEAPTHASRMPTHKRVRPHYSGPCFTSADERTLPHLSRHALALGGSLLPGDSLSELSRFSRKKLIRGRVLNALSCDCFPPPLSLSSFRYVTKPDGWEMQAIYE